MTEEPAWRRELGDKIEEQLGWRADSVLDVVVPHIKATEQRGRDEALREAAEKIRRGWDETRGATQASKVMAFAADLIDPSEPCSRCKGSGIDPELSQPAEGPSYYSMGEPEALVPCVACQYPADKP